MFTNIFFGILQGSYLTAAAANYAESRQQPKKAAVGLFTGIFFGIFQVTGEMSSKNMGPSLFLLSPLSVLQINLKISK